MRAFFVGPNHDVYRGLPVFSQEGLNKRKIKPKIYNKKLNFLFRKRDIRDWTGKFILKISSCLNLTSHLRQIAHISCLNLI